MTMLAISTLLLVSGSLASAPIDIGSRLEPLVDDYLIERLDGAVLALHEPVPREVAIVHDAPWEGETSAFHTVFQDGDVYRMYFRGSGRGARRGKLMERHHWSNERTCYAESRDGIHWTRPELGLFEFQGSKANNIVWEGPGAHNFAPMKDTNPACKPEQRYKALAFMHCEKALAEGRRVRLLYAFQSADGLRWSLMQPEPVITNGAFDSLNVASWDAVRGRYVAFVRKNRPGPVPRDIGTATSPDFIHWTDTTWLEYPGSAPAEMYTNAIAPYDRAPHIFFGFPMRYMGTRDHRRGDETGYGLTDVVFITSRDGLNFHRWDEALIRPGLQRDRWVSRRNLTARGLPVTRSDVHGGPELSLYSTEGYAYSPLDKMENDAGRLRRFTIRVDGFVSVRAGSKGGEMVTKPLVFSGDRLQLNLSTSAAGSIRVEIQDASGTPIPGFALGDCPEIFEDRLDHVVNWKQGHDLSRLSGKSVRLRFVLNDADLYSMRFTE